MVITEALIGAICVGVGSLLTLWWTKGVEAQVRLIEARKASNLEALEHTKKEVVELRLMVEDVNDKLQVSINRHHDCEVRCARLESKLDVIENKILNHGAFKNGHDQHGSNPKT